MASLTRYKSQLVVVAGVSGAGRSTALRALEDLGFYCVDSLPPSAFEAALTACEQGNLQHVALGVDVRVRSFVADAVGAIDRLRGRHDFTLLFLDASDATLLARFSSTRRPHPLRTLGDSESERSLALVDGIKLERERLSPLRADASLVIDTSNLSVHALRRTIVDLFRPKLAGTNGMTTRFVTFGFKYGPPADCDMSFDLRFIENPYFVPELKPQSGLDAPIQAFVRARPEALRFAEQATEMLASLIPSFAESGKSYLTVGFGCTGGRHRSVAMAEWVRERLEASGLSNLGVVHRDILRVDSEGRAEDKDAAVFDPGRRGGP